MSTHRASWKIVLLRWLKFNAVGAVGIVVQLVALIALTRALHLNYLAATALAVEAAVIHNFLWHQRFTWSDRKGGGALRRFVIFNLTTGAFSIGGNLLLMRLLVGSAHFQYLLADAISITACSLVNFSVSDRLVFLCGADPPVHAAPARAPAPHG